MIYWFKWFLIRLFIMFGLVRVEVFLRLEKLFFVILCKMCCMILLEWVLGRLGVNWIRFGVVMGLIFWCIYVFSVVIFFLAGFWFWLSVMK